ncbi:MAG: C2H2-type zinc finger protein [Nitrososphaera sp.]
MGLFKKKAEGPVVLKCQYCGTTFDDKERLKRHSRKAHSEKGGDLPSSNPFGFS